ncbi:MAG: hypothetical protein LC791_12975 [Acidobacteria bacterium]|nr:hypothetical protein [Acidobacteriota bacterium]
MAESNSRASRKPSLSLRQDVAALTRRVRRLEQALRSTKPRAAAVDAAAAARWENETDAARRRALEEYHAREREAFMSDPMIGPFVRAAKKKRDAFLKERGFDPEE